MQEQRSLYWRLNWYRQSELEGALLLGRLVRHTSDPFLVLQLTKHCADEARHAWQWARTISQLGLPSVRVRRSYQSFYLHEVPAPRTVAEFLALTHVFEHRVHRHFTEALTDSSLPAEVRRTLRAMLKDEEGHLEWIAAWLSSHKDAEVMLDRHRAADERVAARLAPYADCLWQVEGLGDELGDAGDDDARPAQEKRDQAQSQHPS